MAINLAQASGALGPAYQVLPQVQTSLAQTTAATFNLPPQAFAFLLLFLKQQALVSSSAAGHFLNKGHSPREMTFRSPLASKFPYLPLN